MELRQLEYLIAVVDEGSFTKAADRLKIVQSAVSHHIGKLERELGVELLRRVRPTVAPTPAGELLVIRARRVLAEIAAARSDLSSLRGLTAGDVDFGATVPAASIDVAELLASFRSLCPGVRVRLREGTGQELIEMVRQGALDLAIVSAEPEDLPHGLDAEVIDVDHLVLVGPPGHPLESGEPIPVATLDGVELIGFRAGAGLRRSAELAYEAAGVAPHVVVESNEMPVLLGLVEHGLGLAVLPEGFLEQSRSQLWHRPIEPRIVPSLTLVWRARHHRSPAAEAFLNHVLARRAVETQSGVAPREGRVAPVGADRRGERR